MCFKFHPVPVQCPHTRNKWGETSEKSQQQKENEPERNKICSRAMIFLRHVFGFELWHSQHVNYTVLPMVYVIKDVLFFFSTRGQLFSWGCQNFLPQLTNKEIARRPNCRMTKPLKKCSVVSSVQL